MERIDFKWSSSPQSSRRGADLELSEEGRLLADMFMDPKVGSMIPEDLSTKCSIGSMIQSDPMAQFDSRS